MKIHIEKVSLHRPGENAANAMRNAAGTREKEKISAHGQLESDRRSFGIELLLCSCWAEERSNERVFRAAASTQQQAPAMHYVAGAL